MAEIINLRNNPHHELELLLPWFVNGTLDARDCARLEAHLAECPECQAELTAERQLAAAIESSPIGSDEDWERMQRKLAAAESARLLPSKSLWRKRVPLGWAVASPVAAAAAIALLIINVPSRQAPQVQYHALGAPSVDRPANIIVQFQPSSRLSDVQHALQSVDARLVDGPTQTGAYLLHVDEAKRELALNELRANEAVTLAQPIDGPERE